MIVVNAANNSTVEDTKKRISQSMLLRYDEDAFSVFDSSQL